MAEKCNARLTKRGGRCAQRAGWGTDHVGRGSCKLHGGCHEFPSGPANPNYKHGLYARARTPDELAEFEQWTHDNGTSHDKLSADEEFLLFRIERAIGQLDDGALEKDPEKSVRMLNSLAELRLKAQKLRGGEKAAEVNVTVNARDELLGRIAGITARVRTARSAGGADG